MAGNDKVQIKDAGRNTVSILSDEITQWDGDTLTTSAEAQVIKLGIGASGVASPVSDTNPAPVKDATAPYVPLTHIGQDVLASTDTIVAAATAGRIKVEINHAGTAGLIWIGVGRAAQVGVGNWLEPGDQWVEFTASAVHVLIAGTGSAQRVTGMEWVA